jgi:Secretion system C-terminal sorting domain/Pregnancy-associated plasma protein-A
MIKFLKLNILLFVFVVGFISNAQTKKCNTTVLLEKKIKEDPTLLRRIQNAELKTQQWITSQSKATQKKTAQIVTIPVVIHVLWHEAVENISDAQIQSQIDVLNKDFRLLNTDKLPSTHPFFGDIADTQIQFVLAKQDPKGNPTNGITRTFTNKLNFDGNDESEKFTAKEGIDNWKPTKYLNIWVCNIDCPTSNNCTLGYAHFPDELANFPEYDGVVIRYEAFGTIGTAGSNGFSSNLGRTATHEVGHWLNLNHIWGDTDCGDDLVADTKPSKASNYDCPNFPYNPNSTCGSDANGEMYMNYMDYVDDNCMNMFTRGQVARMQAALNLERVGILTSLGGTASLGVANFDLDNALQLYPNPSSGIINLNFANYSSFEKTKITVLDIEGKKLKTIENIANSNSKIDLSSFNNGIYFLKIQADGESTTKKIIISK